MHDQARDPRGEQRPGVSAVLALVLSTIGFFALAVLGLGIATTIADADIITVPGLGQAPGILGMIGALLAFAGLEWAAVRVRRPLYRSTWVVALGAALAHLLVVAVCALVVAADAVTAVAVAGDLVLGGASAAVLLAAAVAGWAGVALRRTRAQHPRWPWEN